MGDEYEEVEYTTDGRQSGLKGMLAALGVTISLGTLSIIAIIFVIGMAIGGLFDGFFSIFGSETTANVRSTRTVVQSIQPLGQLVSLEVQLAKADIRVSVRSGIANACGRSAGHVAAGAVQAGIDLTQLGEDDVEYDEGDDTYTIHLPPAQLTSCRIDFIDQYDRTTSTCGPAWDDLRQLAQYEALIEFRDDALAGEILSRAQREAHTTLTNFLQLSTGSQVNVNFRDSGGMVFPTSCQPQSPTGWVYDPDGDDWARP